MAEINVYEDDSGSQEETISVIQDVELYRISNGELDTTTMLESTDPDAAVEQKTSPFSVSDLNVLGRGYEALNERAVKKRRLAVIAPPIERRWEYRVYEEPQVIEILEKHDDGGLAECFVQLDNGREELISLDSVLEFPNGTIALAEYEQQHSGDSDSEASIQEVPQRRLRRARHPRNANISSFVSSDDELVNTSYGNVVRRGRRPTRFPTAPDMTNLKLSKPSRSHASNVRRFSSPSPRPSSSRSEEHAIYKESTRTLRNATKRLVDYYNLDDVLVSASEDSDDDVVHSLKRKRTSSGRPGRRKSRTLRGQAHLSSDEDKTDGVRRSGRNVTRKDMREVGEDYIPEKTTATRGGTVKYTGAKEYFQTLADDDDFRLRHCQTCDTCIEADDSPTKGDLIYCQGCTLSYHLKCLGPRNSREHLVTKIGEEDFVLQCRRCIGLCAQKDALSPDQGLCFSCHEPGESTSGFRERKTTKEEQKDREDNAGEDPITDVIQDLVNNYRNVLFRCLSCFRSCHMHHLPPKMGSVSSDGLTEEDLAAERFGEYHASWFCKDCSEAPADVETLVAWRPLDVNLYEPGQPGDQIPEDSKEYLIKWKNMSYHSVKWMPGAWVWSMTAASMRKAFARRESLPKMTTADAVPEDYLRIDVVLAAEYSSIVKLQAEHIAKARITEVTRVLVKFKGLGYEDTVWIQPPSQQEAERWRDFQTAYEDWVMGAYTKEPAQKELRTILAKMRAEDFGATLEMKTQPENLIGGKLMSYQLEGLNWIYFQWFKQQNAILADEMGLGKTIQVIGFLATLKEAHGCWPFLIVVPNSTCPNWRREIKQWAPSLRVVTYYGSAEARKLCSRYELFPEGKISLGCHVVVTSYDAAQDHEFRRLFRGVHWAGLIVDEGQRLKNDKGILYRALNALKPPFKLLLTGTPLQNNARELFNLLQFLDSSINAQQMEEEYVDLTKENVAELHKKLRQYFLRRTKAEVLTMLPPMAQIILPVTVSVLQRQLYKTILAQNPELLKSIMGSTRASGKEEKASLNNILMQLRKCLCHPFVYSQNIEVRSDNAATSHENLVEASSKLQLLAIMLPKLQERGHRVLIFSQFLGMLSIIEDFLDGLGLFYERLDGSMGSLQKQKKIDAFNADGSQLFAFLLSTRAGGVGINLATADTVIIMDPDFNPHQDIQALSRAHRIGQKKKVLVFQLTTRATVEEKILQVGKKKMALDQVLIEQMDHDEDEPKDIASILRYGAEAIFKDEDPQQIKYDSASVDRLLDRSQIENTLGGKDKSAESQFSFAKVWVSDKNLLEEGLGDDVSDKISDPSVWEKILEDRRQAVAIEAAAKEEALGRGRRRRQAIDYSFHDGHVQESSPARRRKFRGKQSDSDDTDFREESEEEDEVASGEDNNAQISMHEDEAPLPQPRSRGLLASQASPINTKDYNSIYQRAQVPAIQPLPRSTDGTDGNNDEPPRCLACKNVHPRGYCPLKLAGVERCPLCGLAHFGYARTCPHLHSVTQLRLMLEALKQSPESQDLKDAAKKRITGIIGDLNQRKKKKEDAIARHAAELRAIEEHQQGEPLQYGNGPVGMVSHGGQSAVRVPQYGMNGTQPTNGYGANANHYTANPRYQPPPEYRY